MILTILRRGAGVLLLAFLVIMAGNTKAFAEPPEPDGWDMKTVYANERVYRSGDFLCFTLYDRVWVVGYYGHEEDLVIPDEIGGRKVEGIIGMKRLSPVKTITVGKYFGELHANTEGKGSMSVFYSIDELEEIRVAESNKNFKSENGVLYSKDMKTLYGIPASIKQTSYTIPETVTQIYCVADPFRNNKTLKEIRFSKNTEIKWIACLFNNLEQLETVDLTGITEAINFCFYECPRLKNVIFDSRLKSINSSFYFLDSLREVKLPKNLRTLGDQGSFVQCPLLEKITVPNRVSYISDGCFYKDNGKVKVTMPPYIKTNAQQGDMSSYYACVSIGGQPCNARGLKSIKVTSPKSKMSVGEKKIIGLYAKCKEYYLGDEEECIYTGNVLKGNVAEDSIKSGLFTFKSDHPEVVSISKSGKLTAVSPGTATITIKCITKPKIKCSIKIKVQA